MLELSLRRKLLRTHTHTQKHVLYNTNANTSPVKSLCVCVCVKVCVKNISKKTNKNVYEYKQYARSKTFKFDYQVMCSIRDGDDGPASNAVYDTSCTQYYIKGPCMYFHSVIAHSLLYSCCKHKKKKKKTRVVLTSFEQYWSALHTDSTGELEK